MNRGDFQRPIASITQPALRARIAEKQRALEGLRGLEADRNVGTGPRTRSFLAIIVALVWGAVPVAFGTAALVWKVRPSYGTYFITFAELAVLVIYGTWWARWTR